MVIQINNMAINNNNLSNQMHNIINVSTLKEQDKSLTLILKIDKVFSYQII